MGFHMCRRRAPAETGDAPSRAESAAKQINNSKDSSSGLKTQAAHRPNTVDTLRGRRLTCDGSSREATILMAFADGVPPDQIAAKHNLTVPEILAIKRDAFAKAMTKSEFATAKRRGCGGVGDERVPTQRRGPVTENPARGQTEGEEDPNRLTGKVCSWGNPVYAGEKIVGYFIPTEGRWTATDADGLIIGVFATPGGAGAAIRRRRRP
jgi:hypothetical protein